MASGDTLSSEIPLKGAFSRVALRIPTMTSGCDVYLQAAGVSGGTYERVYATAVGDSTPAAVFVDSSVTNAIVPFGAPPSKWLKIELSTAMTATTVNFEVIVSD
jgi:hypothetical protein